MVTVIRTPATPTTTEPPPTVTDTSRAQGSSNRLR